MSDGETTWTYTYDVNGMRTSRTDGTTAYTYVYNGSQLTQMTVGTSTYHFTYDASGRPMSISCDDATYYYAVNLQGDVVAILDDTGFAVVSYTYDAWGNLLVTTGVQAETLGVLNPLRYRGYVYDQETGLYYLQTRYYNPEWGRFINADGYVSTGHGLLGNNMFTYCNNNPVNMTDASGTFPTPGQIDTIVRVTEGLYELLTESTVGFMLQKQSYSIAAHTEITHYTKTIIDFDLIEEIKTIDVTLTAVSPS